MRPLYVRWGQIGRASRVPRAQDYMRICRSAILHARLTDFIEEVK